MGWTICQLVHDFSHPQYHTRTLYFMCKWMHTHHINIIDKPVYVDDPYIYSISISLSLCLSICLSDSIWFFLILSESMWFFLILSDSIWVYVILSDLLSICLSIHLELINISSNSTCMHTSTIADSSISHVIVPSGSLCASICARAWIDSCHKAALP